jgi:hypothetical protein
MATSHYFNNQRATAEQLLLEDMIIESIRNHGIDVYYIPRTSQSSTDELFGDDPVKYFKKAFKVEMYMDTFRDYEGNKEFFSKFGLQVAETAKLTIARRTYEKVIMKNMDDELNHHVPKEGDLVYLPIQYKLMEIKFVEEEKNFFQLGRNSINPYMYTLTMEAFKYNGELLQTGYDEIDRIANKQAVTVSHILSDDGNQTGTYELFEWVYQGTSLETATAKAIVAGWDLPSQTLELRNIKGQFTTGSIKGVTSGAIWSFASANTMGNSNLSDINDNVRIELEGDNFLDFTETNPFGEPHEF